MTQKNPNQMSWEDKKKCSEIWKLISGETIMPVRWNQKAADSLATIVIEIKDCSIALDMLPRPQGMRPGWFWLAKTAYGIIKRTVFDKNTYKLCINIAIIKWKSQIHIDLMGI